MIHDVYRNMLAKLYGHGEKNTDKIVATLHVTDPAIGVNRETMDLELRVRGELQIKDGESRREEYRIHFPLWNYSLKLTEIVHPNIYERVMEEERDDLFEHYLDTWAALGEEPKVDIRRREFLKKENKLVVVAYHPLIQALVSHQAGVYGRMLTLQSKREQKKARRGDEIVRIVQEAEARHPVEAK